MDNIRFYEINAKYVDYLAPFNGDSTSLARRCNDYALLEDKCRSYKRK